MLAKYIVNPSRQKLAIQEDHQITTIFLLAVCGLFGGLRVMWVDKQNKKRVSLLISSYQSQAWCGGQKSDHSNSSRQQVHGGVKKKMREIELHIISKLHHFLTTSKQYKYANVYDMWLYM